MKTPRMVIAMGYIDDDLVSQAVEYVPRYKKWNQLRCLKWSTLAACFALIVLLPFVMLHQQQPSGNQQPTPDITSSGTINAGISGQSITLSLEEAQRHAVFGTYFPTVIADGYSLEAEVGISVETRLEARFRNEETGDVLRLMIYPKKESGATETGIVYYNWDIYDIGSYIYLDGGDYIVEYKSDKCDLKTLPGFETMVESAEYFAE